ncbi:hypothetical protein [Desulfomonile tiedjei]|uniref:Uncharacterized protein n=1 Tax=Desulfomonile tiedjei (strain ATCC 49306 / DSM 6799 / DCB-1) TaxID=706587 RepID=I4CEQ1_DESTA|nr:hypothetical protein [Desulfomonile tiedjei]AFM28042.1 hypothetical protein Desti_5457 [Desulfomonile tiedjei DSM 6799]
MRSIKLFRLAITLILTVWIVPSGVAGEPLQKCSIQGIRPDCAREPQSRRGPSCGIELTCTDKPMQLGYSDGVCFRATCPGIWGLMHKRADQASFRRRYFSYRHYAFNGTWELKGQGIIESGPAAFRELFLVLPEDLIEFKLRDPDCNAAIEVTNLGYVKKGSVEELKKWVAYNTYLERPVYQTAESQLQRDQAAGPWYPGSPYGYADIIISPMTYMGRLLGLPWF